MKHDTDSPDGENDDGVSLTMVDVDYLTAYERREVIPSCDSVLIGYDSSYSDKPESTKRMVDPEHVAKTFTRHGGVRGRLVGTDADDHDRSIGVAGSTLYTSTSSGRIGSVLWVGYPEPEPAKTTYDVTFRSLTGNWSKTGDADDPEVVNSLTESTVDKQSYDDIRAPPEDERRIEDVDVGEERTERRVAVDVPVRITLPDFVDEDEVVERARKKIGNRRGSGPDKAEYREDLPPVGDHIDTFDQVGRQDRNNRRAVRYWIEDVDVEAVDTHGGDE